MVDLKVVLNRAPNAFCLMDVAVIANQINPKVKFEDVVLKIRKVNPGRPAHGKTAVKILKLCLSNSK